MFAIVRPQRRCIHATRILRGGGASDADPRWTLPSKDYHKYTYQPTIPDKHFNVAHYNYAPITLWLRARRPTLEKIGLAMINSAKNAFHCFWTPFTNYWESRLPGFGYKCMGFLGLLLGYNLAVMYWLDRTDAYMALEKLALYRVGHHLGQQGFFHTDQEDKDARCASQSDDMTRLQDLWKDALADATKTKSFNTLLSYLPFDESDPPVKSVPEPLNWRLNSMPYGRDNPDSKVFASAPKDTPAAENSFALDIGTTGDYIDRQDNKAGSIAKGRHWYTSAYLPPTK